MSNTVIFSKEDLDEIVSTMRNVISNIQKAKASKQSSKGVGFEIECFTDGKINFWRQKDGKYSNQPFDSISESFLRNQNKYKIYQVRRIEDNEVFTISDEVSVKESTHHKWFGKIYEFKMLNNEIIVGIWQNGETNPTGDLHRTLFEIYKVYIPLFTTDDNFPICENDINSYWRLEGWKLRLAEKSFVTDKHWRTFRYKHNGEEYILMNKPCLSVNDVKEYIEKYFDYPNGINVGMIKELAKQKINA